ncbi:anthranilate synthase family protein [Streptomyces sp. W16]|uniref:anthranilate synthase family protein n=1 Tax=Streptomyces sp. W16 TaxID=3076631 RepID=UPI00295B64D9|nr:anthranilate synthase family protein [Streptomyces sp. W16]MDV9169073.1 anthranilate synthase family protein [Streptomyces sp. W16]
MSPLLDRVLAGGVTEFALLHRAGSAGPDEVDLLVGPVSAVASLADLPVPDGPGAGPHEVLAVLPYRQVTERGYPCPDDGAPLLALTVEDQQVLPLHQLLAQLPDEPVEVVDGAFDIDDDRYADTVRRVVDDEIGRGEGANFVIRRSYVAELPDWSAARALAFFRRLLCHETGAYWTFLIHTRERTFVGATPERHLSLAGGRAVMNPVSGTYRYPPTGPVLSEVMGFLADAKETDELYMVVDEELKMMGRVCERGGRVTGPYLKEMARLAHTEYLLEGDSTADVRDILRETMFAPTVTGSPLESAARVISRYEHEGRGYYSGVAALIGRDGAGRRAMDSVILIRTADIDPAGTMRIGVGATLVRHSDPESEVAETRATAAGLLSALGTEPTATTTAPGTRRRPGFANHPDVLAALRTRNATLAGFWLEDSGTRAQPHPGLAGRRILVVDAEDTFTSMARHALASLGPAVTVRRFDEPYSVDEHDLVIVGPGPGDPRDTGHPKIAHLRGLAERLLGTGKPFFAVCLGHQVLSTVLGLDLVRRDVPNQGTQVKIDFFGRTEVVGFYNTFTALSGTDTLPGPAGRGPIRVARDPGSGEIHALRGRGFASVQFHPVSVLTRHGTDILGELLSGVLADN